MNKPSGVLLNAGISRVIIQMSEILNKRVTLQELVRPPIISCTIDDTIETVLKRMRKFGLSSLPVYDKENKFPIGIITPWTITNFLLQKPQFALSQKICQFWPETVDIDVKQDVKEQYGPDGLETVYTFPVDTDIQKIFEIFAQGIHRVFLTYKTEDRENILQNLSQSDVIRFLFTESDVVDHKFLEKNLDELKCIVRPAVTMDINKTVSEAIETMVRKKVTAIALFDEEKSNEIVSTFSASDLRNLDSNILQGLNKISLKTYLEHSRSGRHRRPTTITGKNTLGEALKRLVMSHVHRLWEVSDDGLVTGVLSTTDIFKALSPTTIE